MVELLSPIALPDAKRRRLRVFADVGLTGHVGLLRSDRLGTIDLRVDQTGRVAHRVNLPRYPGKRKELHFGVGFSKRNFSGF